MIHAYQEIYLTNVQKMMGDMFDYAINRCKIPGEEFVQIFLNSTVCRAIENGEPAYLAGKSGIEAATELWEEATDTRLKGTQSTHYSRSAEYWIGWAIAYYQWYSNNFFRHIFTALSFAELRCMYDTLHEADISKFVEIASSRMRECFPDSNLKRLRNIYGCSQADLAAKSGVSLRAIQMYEQRRKDINKASGESIYRLARVLGCSMEDLLERNA